MRVNIDHKEVQQGLLKKKTYYQVDVRVEFSEEERHILDKDEHRYRVVLERPVPTPYASKFKNIEDVWNLTVNRLLNPSDKEYPFLLDTLSDAKAYEAEVTEALKELKAYIEANSGIDEKSKSFEL